MPSFNLLQHLDYKPVHTERPGELIAYYKIASKQWLALNFFQQNEASFLTLIL